MQCVLVATEDVPVLLDDDHGVRKHVQHLIEKVALEHAVERDLHFSDDALQRRELKRRERACTPILHVENPENAAQQADRDAQFRLYLRSERKITARLLAVPFRVIENDVVPRR